MAVRLPLVGEESSAGDAAERYVPAGPTWVGGDPDAPDGLPSRRWWVDGFFLKRDPVTNLAYIRFLDDLVARGDEASALRFAPTEDFDGRGACLYARSGDGRFLLTTDRLGRVWAPDSPVVLVSWEGATAYAAWLAEREGRLWRLPHDVEWEKAGRGADRRLQPWGDHLDPTWANVSTSHAGPPRWTPVGSFPLDESPYGVRGLAGNVRDWCGNGYRRRGPDPGLTRLDPIDANPGELRMIRGGAWGSTPRVCRLAGRFASRPWERVALVGFRLARSWG
jgi:serine/threonine-protein kinase